MEGNIVRLTGFGAFVELEPGMDGLIHISNLNTEHHVKHPKEVVEVGQKVNVMVKGTKYFGGKPITEFLFNFTKFLAIMEKMDFELVEMKNFSELCADSPWCTRYMTENEKNYSFKNIYFILKKK